MKTRKCLLIGAAAFAAFGFSSCATGPYARSGQAVGTLGGAALGAVVGHQSGSALEGAALGAALGGFAGNSYGAAQDQFVGTQASPGYQAPTQRVIYRDRPVFVNQPVVDPFFAPAPVIIQPRPVIGVGIGRGWGGGWGRGCGPAWGGGFRGGWGGGFGGCW